MTWDEATTDEERWAVIEAETEEFFSKAKRCDHKKFPIFGLASKGTGVVPLVWVEIEESHPQGASVDYVPDGYPK